MREEEERREELAEITMGLPLAPGELRGEQEEARGNKRACKLVMKQLHAEVAANCAVQVSSTLDRKWIPNAGPNEIWK